MANEVLTLTKLQATQRYLELSTGFEGEHGFQNVTGNFDGQGFSLGALQWCVGQRSVQPLLFRMRQANGILFDEIVRKHVTEFQAKEFIDLFSVPPPPPPFDRYHEQMNFAISISTPHGTTVIEPWLSMLKELLQTFSSQQVWFASGLLTDALKMLGMFGFKSDRALATLFDIRVQNGGVTPAQRAKIEADISLDDTDYWIRRVKDDVTLNDYTKKLVLDSLKRYPFGSERQDLVICVTTRADYGNQKWDDLVIQRKLCIVNGMGQLYGQLFDIDTKYGISDTPVQVT